MDFSREVGVEVVFKSFELWKIRMLDSNISFKWGNTIQIFVEIKM